MFRSVIVVLIAFFIASSSLAQDTGWLRYPSISPDGSTIVFTYKGDLYRVPATGGTATALTIHEAHDYQAVWTPDSKHIVFASDRYGNFDLYVMPITGGEPRRLTFHSANEVPFSVSPDGKNVLFGTHRMDLPENRMFPTAALPELYTIPLEGGRIDQILTTPADEARYSKDGRFILYQDNKGRENPWRKHQLSKVTRDIWIYDTNESTHRKLSSFEGDDRSPVFAENDTRVYYLSEKSGTLNVHTFSITNPDDDRQISSFKLHPVRFLTASNDGVLAYSYDGAIYTQKPGEQASKLNITIAADSRANSRNVVQVNSGASGMAVSPNGKEVAFINRGDIFVTSVETNSTKQVTNTPEIEKEVQFGPDGRTLYYTSERNGKWSIYTSNIVRSEEPYFFASTLIKENPILENANENYQPVLSPDGKELAFIENRTHLKVLNLASKQVRTLAGPETIISTSDNDQVLRWSPDGKWILFQMSIAGIDPGEIGLISTDVKGNAINLTRSGFSDRSPKWILDGKGMIWTSNRDGLKGVAQGGAAQSDVYAMFLTQESWDRFQLSKEEASLLKEAEDKKKPTDPKDSASKDVKPSPVITFDWDGLFDRKQKLTIHSSALADFLVSKDGEHLYYLARFERGHNLWTTNLKTQETKILANINVNGGTLAWDKDQKTIFLNAGGTLSKIDPSSGKRDMINFSSEVMVDRSAEFLSMFDQVWNRTNKTFYSGEFHGADWNLLRQEYLKHLPHVGNNYEFSELLAEMLGELNISHSGSTYGGPSSPTNDATAQLGIFYDFKHRGQGVRILEVIKGGPLDKAGLNVKPGTIIEKIDGVLIEANMDMDVLLNRKADKNVLLSLDEAGKKRDIVVKPITVGAQNSLLYRRWVDRNREEVERESGGKLGYVHIPGMNDGAFRTTFEEIMGRYVDREAMVVDVRFNNGGDLVADLEMFLNGKRFFEYRNHRVSVGFEPNFRWTKPSISLVNESAYSDGHCYAYMYQTMKIGKMVGQPVPGTCTFGGWGTVGDGIRWGVPGVGVKGVEGEYLENRPTYPEIEVFNRFEDLSKGMDEQLKKAIEEIKKDLSKD